MDKHVVKAIETLMVDCGGNVERVVEAFREAVEAHSVSQANKFARFEQPVIELLSSLGGTRVNLDYITTRVATSLGGDAAAWSENKRLCADYIRQNAASEKDGKPIDKDGNVMNGEPLFYLARGLGGICLFKDRLAKVAAAK